MPEISPSRYVVSAGWDDVPHLDAATKAELLRGTLPHLRGPRSRGTPSLGAGAIYPIPWDEIVVKPFEIPDYWPRAYGMDVGWNKTAALWGAWNREERTLYVYSEHYRGHEKPAVHAAAIKARGDWVQGVIDPAANGRAQKDGEQLMIAYRELGLHITNADNGVESGIYAVWEGLSEGRIKAFNTLSNFRHEYSLYRRDENGKIIKKTDHAMDCLRYLVASGRLVARVRPVGNAGWSKSSTRPADGRAGY